MSTILYLHGFNSSPQSHKIGLMAAWLANHRPHIRLIAPFIAFNADRVVATVSAILDEYPDANLIGSSLGGYYATWASQVRGRKAVLINPAVRPHERFDAYLGEQQNIHTGEKYILTTEMVAELRPLSLDSLSRPDRLWVLLQTGDETLDYRDAQTYYAACPQLVEEGGDHSHTTFTDHIPSIVHFLTH